MKHIFVLVLFFCTPVIKSSNILVFVPSPWKSHIVSFEPLFLELAHRGHNVTVVTKFPVKDPPLNYTQLIIKYDVDLRPIMNAVIKERNKYLFLFEDLYVRNKITVDITETYVSSPDVQKFIKEDRSTFDLVIVESFFQQCTVTMGHKYNAPVVAIIPVAPWATQSLQAANPYEFSYIKDFKLDSGKSLDFQSRLLNTLFGLYGLLFEPIIYLPRLAKMMDKYFQYPGYENRPTLTQMLKTISLSLIDSDVMILSPRPYIPSFIEVSGIHIQPSKQINKNLQDFMDRAITGVVYFNFGTILNTSGLPKSTLRILVHVLGHLEQMIIFKWIKNSTQEFPDNFYVDSWLPQQEILNHPNCKLFITHGGVHSLMESINAGIPILGFPVFGDQFQNLKISQENGFGIMSNIFTLTEETFQRDVKLILSDQTFTVNAKRMSSIFHDRPMSALDKAVYWLEYVIRHKGAHHIRSAAVESTWCQYYSLDVIAFIISTILLLIGVCYVFIKCILKFSLNSLFKRRKIKGS